MNNEQLAHELLFDNDFQVIFAFRNFLFGISFMYKCLQLDETGGLYNPVMEKIRQSFHSAFWASVIDDVRLPIPVYTRVFRVIQEVHDGIKDVCSVSIDVGAVIDMELLKTQMKPEGLGIAQQ